MINSNKNSFITLKKRQNFFSHGDKKIFIISLNSYGCINSIEALVSEKLTKYKIFTFILSGSLFVSGIELGSGCVAKIRKTDKLLAGSQKCLLILVTSVSSPISVNSFFYYEPKLLWYKKYNAWVDKLSINGDDRFLSTWSGYFIKLITSKNEIYLHVHNKLNNLIFIEGSSESLQGYFMIEEHGENVAFPLIGGDIILVNPKIKHNIVSSSMSKSIQFFVFNDSPSDYQQEESSDYHIVKHISWQDTGILSRFDREPYFINVGRKLNDI